MKKLIVILFILLVVITGTAFAASGFKNAKSASLHKDGKNAYVDLVSDKGIKEQVYISETKDGKKSDSNVYGVKLSKDYKKASFYTWSDTLGDSRGGPKVFVKDIETGDLVCRGNGLTPGISNSGNYLAYEVVPKNVKTEKPYIVLQDLTTGFSKRIEDTSRWNYWKPNEITWAVDDTYFEFYTYSEKYSQTPKLTKLRYVISTGTLVVV